MSEAKKNTAYYLVFPVIDSTTPAQYKTGISPVDDAYFKDGAGVWTSLSITDTAAEIGTTGLYEIDLTAAEMNHDQIMIKLSASGMADDSIYFDLRTKLVDDLNDLGGTAQTSDHTSTIATLQAGVDDIPTNAELNLRTLATADYFDPAADTVANVTTVATATNLTNLPSIPTNWITATGITASALNGKGDWNIGKTGYSLTQAFPSNFSDLAITLSTGKVTVGTNDDKTGYSVSGTITTLDGLNDFDPATDTVANVTAVGTLTTYTGNTPQTGDSFARIGATGSSLTSLASATNLATVDTVVDGIQTEIGTAGVNLTNLGGMSTSMKTQINTEMLDVMTVDTMAELVQGTPTNTPTMQAAMMRLYMALINKIDVSGTSKEFHNGVGTVLFKKAMSDDNITYTEAKAVTGP